MRRPALFHCSIFFLCVLVRVVPASLTVCLSHGLIQISQNNNILLPSQAAQPDFPIWHALACIWACRAARASPIPSRPLLSRFQTPGIPEIGTCTAHVNNTGGRELDRHVKHLALL